MSEGEWTTVEKKKKVRPPKQSKPHVSMPRPAQKQAPSEAVQKAIASGKNRGAERPNENGTFTVITNPIVLEREDKKKKKVKAADKELKRRVSFGSSTPDKEFSAKQTLEQGMGSITVEWVKEALGAIVAEYPGAREGQLLRLAELFDEKLGQCAPPILSTQWDAPLCYLDAAARTELENWVQSAATGDSRGAKNVVRALCAEQGASVKLLLQLMARAAPDIVLEVLEQGPVAGAASIKMYVFALVSLSVKRIVPVCTLWLRFVLPDLVVNLANGEDRTTSLDALIARMRERNVQGISDEQVSVQSVSAVLNNPDFWDGREAIAGEVLKKVVLIAAPHPDVLEVLLPWCSYETQQLYAMEAAVHVLLSNPKSFVRLRQLAFQHTASLANVLVYVSKHPQLARELSKDELQKLLKHVEEAKGKKEYLDKAKEAAEAVQKVAFPASSWKVYLLVSVVLVAAASGVVLASTNHFGAK